MMTEAIFTGLDMWESLSIDDGFGRNFSAKYNLSDKCIRERRATINDVVRTIGKFNPNEYDNIHLYPDRQIGCCVAFTIETLYCISERFQGKKGWVFEIWLKKDDRQAVYQYMTDDEKVMRKILADYMLGNVINAHPVEGEMWIYVTDERFNHRLLLDVSKYISLILRHKPQVIGITLDEHGWADVKELIEGISEKYPLTIEKLEEIVRTDNKQRYSFNEDKTLIRANQGHSIPVDVELPMVNPPEVLYHGTGEKYTDSIDKQGLISKSRLYVHLSDNIDTAVNVGKRHGKPVVYVIDTIAMTKDGYEFFLSVNGVWLTKAVPSKYLLEKKSFSVSLVCQVKASIRTWDEIPYQTLAGIFKKEIPYDEKEHLMYLLGFFEECSPTLIHAFMEEQGITWQQILDIFNVLPPTCGETHNFRRYLEGKKWSKYPTPEDL